MNDEKPGVAPLGLTVTPRQRWLLVFTLLLALFVSALDQRIVATAVPRILADLGGFPLLSWVFTIYLLTSTIVMPIVGKLSDTFGRKPFLIAGIGVFVIGSWGCGLSTSMEMLIASRSVQGAGGGMITASVIATVADLFPPVERGKYFSLFVATGTIAQLSGPAIGGLLTDTVGWRWCFTLNVPTAGIALVCIWMFFPSQKQQGKGRRKVDVLGAILLAGASTSLLLAIAWGVEEFGWLSQITLGLLISSIVLAVLWVFQERRHPDPILPLALFRNGDFVTSTLIYVLIGAGTFGAVTYLPTFVQTALGASATTSGLITTPQSLGTLAGSFVAGQLLARTGRYRIQAIIGMTVVLAATIVLQSIGVGDAKWHISAAMAVLGLGSGIVTTTISVVIINSVSQDLIGVASGSRQFFQQIGNVVSIALFGLLLTTAYHASFDDNLSDTTRSKLPADVVAAFDDPTVSLDKRRYDPIVARVDKITDGPAMLGEVVQAQREGEATANRDIFIGAAGIAILGLLVAFTMRELPLRRAMEPTEPRKPEVATAPAD